MPDRLAFTAGFWGRAAVVCRAVENRAGPVVDQQFGPFRSWTQAQVFATRLNEGLELPPCEARQIVIGAMLRTSEVLRARDAAPVRGAELRVPASATSPHVQFVLAELGLAITFCRILHSKRSGQKTRLIRNARNALFNAMHYVVNAELAAGDLLAITAKLHGLQAALRESGSQPHGRIAGIRKDRTMAAKTRRYGASLGGRMSQVG
jgi:hypothetical protein